MADVSEKILKNLINVWLKIGWKTNTTTLVEWFPLEKDNIMVKLKDNEGIDDNGISKKVNSQPCHLGSFILSHLKRLLNDVILCLDEFRNNKVYYGDTESIYIHKKHWDIKNKRFNRKGTLSFQKRLWEFGFSIGLVYSSKN